MITNQIVSHLALVFQTIKTRLQDGDTLRQLATGEHLLAASVAGLMTLIFTNPITVVKTRFIIHLKHNNIVVILGFVFNRSKLLIPVVTTQAWWMPL